jgi:hypothetical protein
VTFCGPVDNFRKITTSHPEIEVLQNIFADYKSNINVL